MEEETKGFILRIIMYNLIAIVSLVMIIILVSGVELYSGDSYNFTLIEDYEYYSVVGNSTSVNVSFNGLDVTITPNKYSQTDSFEIIFFNAEDKIIYYAVESDSGGGGGGRGRTIYQNNTIYVNQTDSPETIGLDDEEVEDWRRIAGYAIIALIIVGTIEAILATKNYIKCKKKKPVELKEEEKVEDE